MNPSLGDALRVISRLSQDNLKACAGNTAELTNMFVPPPFTHPGTKAGVGMVAKTSSTVMSPQEKEIETDGPQAPAVPSRPKVPKPTPAKPKN